VKAAIFSEMGLQRAIGELRSMFKASGYLRITASDSKPRSTQQNALIHAAYGQISRELGEQSVAEVRREAKLTLGVPILRAEDEEFRAAYDATIKTLTYEQKLKAMDFWPVTSRMNTDQLSRYYAAMQKQYQAVQFEVAA
jgi:hypothetical protein